MQSRRHEDFGSQSSFGRSRRTTDHGSDGYLMMSPNAKRSWTPRRMEGPPYSERSLGGHRSVSPERRRLVDDGSRRIRSRSPPFMDSKRGRPYYSDDWVTDRDFPTPRYEFFNQMDADSPMRNEFGFGYSRRDDEFEGRRLDTGIREIGSQKSSVMGLYRSTAAPTTENDADLPSSSLDLALGHLGKERVRYPEVRDSYSFDKQISGMKQYDDREKNIVNPNPRDAPFSNLTESSRSRESMGASHYKDYPRTSPRKSRVDHLSYHGGIPLPRDNHQLNSANIPEPLSHSRYEQRQRMDLGRDPDLEINEDMARYRREAFSSPRTGNPDSLRDIQPRIRERVDYLYPSDDIYEKMNLSERVDYNDRDMLNPNLLDHVPQRAETSDYARRNMSSRTSMDHVSLEKLAATNDISFTRPPAEKREYVDPTSVHSRLGRKIPREEVPYMGMVQDRELEHMRVNHDYKREMDTRSQKERMRNSPEYLYDTEGIRLRERPHDLSPYDSSSRYLKRKYTMEDEEENRNTSRSMMNTVTRRQNREYSDDEWLDQEARRRDHPHDFRRRGYDEEEEDPEEWYPSHDHDEQIHDHRIRSYKYQGKYAREDKYAKGFSRSDTYASNHPNRRHVVPNWKNVPIRGGENDSEYEDFSRGSVRRDPHENSKEFKKLVHDYFLSFTKKLNEAPGVRKRHLGEGRAGSLFCIVCGRSSSKEFLDTQRLAMHAFMSHKVGLKAQHLGLLKAICVMLGWDAAISPGTIRWYPELLSSSKALAQKEDLIIWPPVIVVHNISISSNDPNGHGPTTEEALGQFLRGKGMSSGKVKIGKSGNCSIMLVKFLGTFSGLQEAEKIHQYFAKNKHGRKEMEQISDSKGKNENGEKEAESVLFGYMGIFEDLDKVDFDTKKKCVIKSKKEIKDIADAPVKPE